MPRVSAKKKALRARRRENILKRWKKDEDSDPDPTCTRDAAGEAHSAAPSRFHPPPTQSAASYRHSLLPPELANVQEVNDMCI